MTSDAVYMRIALDLALRAKGQTSPNPLVGALVIKNNRIIAKGYHRRCGADHAEIAALKKAGKAARGAKLYVTLEPCSHFGRTPPCVDKIIQSGINEVVVGMIDPNPVNNGKSIQKLRRAGLRVKVGLFQKELKKINESFVKFIKYKMPFVVVKWAQTLDGKIATAHGQSKWITSEKTRDFARRLRNDFDAILVGINTVLNDNPRLNATRKTKKIKKIVVDTALNIPVGANLFKRTKAGDVIIATTKKSSPRKRDLFLKQGVNVIVCPTFGGRVDLKWLFRALAKKEITSIFVEGGSQIIGSILKRELADKILVFIAPKILGDHQAISPVKGFTIRHVNSAIKLKDVTTRRIADDILMEGYVYGNR